ncbi:hypothetical protein HY994_03270 [Candidatus Micrarchaeota archaeon]|nr:hypothetical protein [Candidatus Micrarchaeota archaeon]
MTFSLNTRRKTYIPEEYRHRCLPEPSEVPQPRITRVQSVLDWKNAEQIGEQIRKANEAAGEDPNTGFDEIHFHMPDSLPRHQTPGEKQSLLNVLSIFLIPGGYFHHTFERTPIFSDLYSQRTSPYTEHTLLHQDSIEPCTDKQIDNRYRSNGKKIRNAAASAGLRLEKYGFRCWPKNEKESEPYWMTRPGRTENSPEHKLIKATLKEYTQYGAFMNHYVILGKPRKHQKKRQNQ